MEYIVKWKRVGTSSAWYNIRTDHTDFKGVNQILGFIETYPNEWELVSITSED